MNVTSANSSGQAVPARRRSVLLFALATALAGLLSRPTAAETHANLQSVTATGASAWTGSFPFTLRGVLLCDPDEMLDPTPQYLPWDNGANVRRMGGEWQVVLQAVDPGDRGGTTCWMGQNYGNQPWIHDGELSYTNEAWTAEVLRLNFDRATLHPFRAGDLIEVTARQALFYGGKRNINEGHDLDPAFDFEVRLVTAAYGIPAPETLTLADVMRPGGSPEDPSSWLPIFDSARATGGEHWQGMRVRLNDLSLVTTNGWDPAAPWGNRLCTVTDGAGRYFAVRHPRTSLGPPPAVPFDAIGIFTQESGSSTQGTNGYELFLQQILPHLPTPEVAIDRAVTLSWPATTDSYQLEWRSEADSGEWTPISTPPVVIEGRNTVILPPSHPERYYRLRKLD